MNAPRTTLQARKKYPAVVTYEYLQRMAERHKKGASSMRIEELDKKIIEYQKKIDALTKAYEACPTYTTRPKVKEKSPLIQMIERTQQYLEDDKIAASLEEQLELDEKIAVWQGKIDYLEETNLECIKKPLLLQK